MNEERSVQGYSEDLKHTDSITFLAENSSSPFSFLGLGTAYTLEVPKYRRELACIDL